MNLFTLALKNLTRYKRRTLLTSTILMAGIILYVVSDGMLLGFEKQSIRNLINLSTGHLKIFDEDYNEETMKGGIEKPDSIVSLLREFSFIRGVTYRLKLRGFLDNSVDQFPVLLTGILPQRDSVVFGLNKYVRGQLREGIWIGRNLKSEFGVKKGDYLYINFRGKRGAIVSLEMRIDGIVNAPDPEINNYQVFLPLRILQEEGDFDGEVTEIDVLTDNLKKVKDYEKILSKRLKGLRVETWMEEGADFLAISKGKAIGNGVIIFFIILIAIVGTANTMMMSVYEKVREIGTLKAIGMTDREVLSLFLIEGFLIGLFGTILGLMIGGILDFYLIKKGIDFSPLLGDFQTGYRVLGVVKSEWKPASFIISMVIGPLSTLISSYFPSRKAMKMTPAECLRSL